MNWSLFFATFTSIFMAELGDKTQLATLSLSTGQSSRWVIFAGSATALVLSSAIAVLGGEMISRWISPIWLKRLAGVMFVAMGALMLFSKEELR